MSNPKYKKLTRTEIVAAARCRELMPEKIQNAIVMYFRIFCIVFGFGFLIKGIVCIIWRTFH